MRRAIVGADLGRQALSLAPALELARDKIRSSPDELIAHAFPDSDAGLCPAALIGDRHGTRPGSWEAFDAADRAQRQRLLEAGADATEKVEREGEQAVLSAEEQLGLEAIIRFTARPAIVMQGGRFPDPAVPWQSLLAHQPQIARAAESVGRIQVTGTPEPFIGTGFVVGEGIVMTNCHVARRFAVQQRDGSWALGAGMKPTIDFADNPDADPPLEFSISEVIGIHVRLDLALLRASTEEGAGPFPDAMPVAGELPGQERRQVYVLGYPASDPRNDPAVMRKLFGDIYNVKRLQPGEIMSGRPGDPIAEPPCSAETSSRDVLFHDASTLGGNSGSCVIDLESNELLGLHYAGLYTKYNQAVALSSLNSDPLLRDNGVSFV